MADYKSSFNKSFGICHHSICTNKLSHDTALTIQLAQLRKHKAYQHTNSVNLFQVFVRSYRDKYLHEYLLVFWRLIAVSVDLTFTDFSRFLSQKAAWNNKALVFWSFRLL